MKTYEVTFCYGQNRGNAENIVVRARNPINAIKRAGDEIPDRQRESVDETLFEVLVRELGWGTGARVAS